MKFWDKLILLTMMGLPISLLAQTQWSLRDCIDYARRENIKVKKAQVTEESSTVDIKQSKAALFPSLSGSISQNYNRAKDSSNGYQYKGLFAGQYGLSANWTVFDGLQNVNSIKQAKLQNQADNYYTQQQQNNIEISLTQTYMQLLYAKESIKNNENIVASSLVQLNQSKDFFDAGSITRSEYAQVEAQYSSDKYNLVLARNSYDNYILQLKQLLELNINDQFDPYFPNIKDDEIESLIPSKYEVYNTALAIMPEVKNSELGIDIAQLEKSSAKGGYLPTLSLNAGISSGNTWNSSYPSFSTQMGRNFNQYVGFTISMPIFDNRKNKSNVEKANLQIQDAQLTLTQTQKDLLSTIETLYQDAVSGQSKYNAAKDKVTSTELSYTLVKEQYALGMRNTVELTTEQTNYANALQDFLQAKYSALLNLKLLNFYQGKEITLE